MRHSVEAAPLSIIVRDLGIEHTHTHTHTHTYRDKQTERDTDRQTDSHRDRGYVYLSFLYKTIPEKWT